MSHSERKKEIYEIEVETARLLGMLRSPRPPLFEVKRRLDALDERWAEFGRKANIDQVPVMHYWAESNAIDSNFAKLFKAITELENNDKLQNSHDYLPTREPLIAREFNSIQEFLADMFRGSTVKYDSGASIVNVVYSKKEERAEWGRFIWEKEKEIGKNFILTLELQSAIFAGLVPPDTKSLYG